MTKIKGTGLNKQKEIDQTTFFLDKTILATAKLAIHSSETLIGCYQ